MNPEFVRLLESLANGVVIADSTGSVIYSNQFLERMFGYEHGHLLGQRIEVLLPAEVRDRHAHHRAQYNAAPETRLMGAGRDLLGRRRDGSVFPVEVGLSPMKTPEGMRVVAIVTDITTRKHAEQRSVLQRDVALILSTADTIHTIALNLLETIALSLGWKLGALWIVDTDSEALRNIALWHAPGAEAHEFETASRRLSFRQGGCLLGHVWETGKPKWVSDLAGIEGFVRASEARAAGLHSVFELPVLVGTQVLGVLEFFSQEIRPPDEDLIEIAVAVASQIGQFVERKRNERALGIFELRYRSLFENAVFGILRSTADGEVLDANPALVTMLGYDDVGEVLRLNLNEHVYRDTRDRQRLFASAAAADRFDGFETEWKTKAGGMIRVRLSGRVIRTDEGNLAGLEAIVEDVTQRRLLEQQYRQAQKMEAIGRLAGGVAHDFNNLLTIIAVSTDTLIDLSANNEPLRETADEIARATEQGASLVRQLMAFGRAQPQRLESVDVREVINSSQRMLQILAGEDIQFEFNFHEGECLVAIEPSRLEQILMNLVANSRDAMPGGGAIRVSTSLADVSEQEVALYVGLKPAKHVKLRIADTGHGIPDEIQPHIFEPFFSTKAEEGRGNGLGLSTVYAIVRQHEGHIICESTIGKGTEFTVFLPAAEQAAPLRPQDPASKISRRGSANILLVEDQPALRASVRRILEQSGYKVVAAADGVEALKASEDHGPFDLLVTDIALPHMRGTELAQRLLQLQPRLRVLYMSGYSEEKVPSDAGHFIPKPFKREALIRKIREVLDS